MKVERKQETGMQPPHACYVGGGAQGPCLLVAMVTLDHSSPRPPAHLFSTLGLGAGPKEQPQGGRVGSPGAWGRRPDFQGQIEGEILESGATHLSGWPDITPTLFPL